MACAVARLWDEETGGGGGGGVEGTTVLREGLAMSRKRRSREEREGDGGAKRRRRSGSPVFRPWTPQGQGQGEGQTQQEEPLALVAEAKQEASPPSPQPSQASANSADTAPSSSQENGTSSTNTNKPGERRNYKNMSRERRIEANARERTRVHTISAAFESLRRAVPAYSHNQKLSKLSVLRIAASYILTLSRVLGEDYSADQSRPSIAECIDNVSATIQSEGKIKKK